MMITRIPLLAALTVLALSTSSTAIGHSDRGAAASAKLAKALAGRTAGPAVRCAPFRNEDMKVIDDGTILFGRGRTVYLQRPAGGCPSLRLGGYSLVSRQFGSSRACQGDINEVVDLRSGVTVGSCVFAPFVPYTKGN